MRRIDKDLLDSVADVNLRTPSGVTPLMIATACSSQDLLGMKNEPVQY